MSEEMRPSQRPIRSFVLRQGRMTEGQRQAFARLWPRFGLTLAAGQPLDPRELFANDSPTHLEIGFGNGDALAEMAASHPHCNYLGVEVHRPGIGHLLLSLEQRGLSNVRVLCQDATEVLDALPQRSLGAVYLLFPDPWPKTRHHKRRIVQPPFLDRAARVLRPGGRLHMATDWEDYAEQMLALLRSRPEFNNISPSGDYLPRPEDRPRTRFEQRGQRLGHGVWDLVFERR
jgi:tRNA (guanine-N7-)-methyltransferase